MAEGSLDGMVPETLQATEPTMSEAGDAPHPPQSSTSMVAIGTLDDVSEELDDEEDHGRCVPREVSFSTDPGEEEDDQSLQLTTASDKVVPSSPDLMINGTVSPYSDFLAKQSAEIKAAKEKERQALVDLTSPVRSPPSSSKQETTTPAAAGTITAYSDFVNQQSAQLKAAKEKERQARALLNTPVRPSIGSTSTTTATTSPVVTPYGDFVAQQSMQLKKSKEMERQARAQLNAPIRSQFSSPDATSSTTGVVAPHCDFVTQQSARLKAEKAKEREARTMLNAPVGSTPLDDFTAQQSASIKAAKEKEREARTMLNAPVGSTPLDDFTAQQSASIKAAKEKEREARQRLNAPVGSTPLDDFTAQQSASIKAAKEKEREARAGLSKISSSTTLSATDRLAADLRRQKEEAQQKLKDAMELKHGYRNGVPESATDRLAAEMKRQRQHELEQKMQAEEQSRSFRHTKSQSATEVLADQIKRHKDETLRKKQEAEEYSRSYSATSGESAQDIVAARLKKQKEEDYRRKMEATNLTTAHRSASYGTGSAQERVAMEAKKRRDNEIQRKKEEEESLLQYVKELAERGDEQEPTEATEDETQFSVDSPSCNLEGMKAKTESELESLRGCTSLRNIAADFNRGIQSESVTTLKKGREEELLAIQAAAKQKNEVEESEPTSVKESEDSSGQTPGAKDLACVRQGNTKTAAAEFCRTASMREKYDQLKAKTSSELATLNGGNSAKDRAQQFASAFASPNLDRIKSRTFNELSGLTGKGASLRDRTEEFNRVSASKAAMERLKLQTENELAAVRTEQQHFRGQAQETDDEKQSVGQDCESITFSAEELASFEEEKSLRERELADLRKLPSKQSLACIRSRTAEELEQLNKLRKDAIKTCERGDV